jgi:hypothetical protein
MVLLLLCVLNCILTNKWGWYYFRTELRPIGCCKYPVVCPRELRNWLFIGHANAGPRAAAMYTLVEYCRIIGVNPEDSCMLV